MTQLPKQLGPTLNIKSKAQYINTTEDTSCL